MNLTQDIKHMVGMTDPIENLNDLFIHTLKDIYYAEKYLVDALETMAEKAIDTELKKAFVHHRSQTISQAARLEKIFGMLGLEVEEETCEAIKGLVEEANEIIDDASPALIDEGLVYAALAVEHYEVARYTSLTSWAMRLGRLDVANLLQETLSEERHAGQIMVDYTGLEAQHAGAKSAKSSAHGQMRQH